MKNQRSFSGSFQRVSQWQPCYKLAHHYRGAMREVVGILDKWAANDPERFVFCHVDAIAEQCKKYQSKNLHGKRWVEKVLAELRRRHVISKPLTRIRRHEEVTGCIVAPHDCLTVREDDGLCVLVGQLAAPGCWKRVFVNAEGVIKAGPVHWCGWPIGACSAWPRQPEKQGQAGGVAAPQAGGVAGMQAGMQAGNEIVKRPVGWPVTTLQLADDSATVKGQNPALTVIAVKKATEGSVQAVPAVPAKSGSPANQQRQAGMAGASSPSSSSPSKATARQRFLKFVGNHEIDLPATMRCAMPKEDEFQWIVKQLDALGEEELASIIYDWEEMQSPPLRTLQNGRWTRWLETGRAMVAEKMEDIRVEKEYAARRTAKQKP
jgi:hypothetical protein